MRNQTTIPPGLQKVPPFPAVAARLLTLLSKPVPDVRKVADVISSDPSLTARVLNCVNSYEFGLSNRVSNVRQAIGLMGLERTRQVTVMNATAMYVRNLMTAELLRCWHHCVATAVLANEIADGCGEFSEAAFTMGIMHDIGRIGLFAAYPQEYQRLIHNAEDQGLDLVELEKQEFGMDHAEAGQLLADSWQLPRELFPIIGRHHHACEGHDVNLLRIVHIACSLADTLGFGVVVPPTQPDFGSALDEFPMLFRTCLRRTPEELSQLIEQRIATVT